MLCVPLQLSKTTDKYVTKEDMKKYNIYNKLLGRTCINVQKAPAHE